MGRSRPEMFRLEQAWKQEEGRGNRADGAKKLFAASFAEMAPGQRCTKPSRCVERLKQIIWSALSSGASDGSFLQQKERRSSQLSNSLGLAKGEPYALSLQVIVYSSASLLLSWEEGCLTPASC